MVKKWETQKIVSVVFEYFIFGTVDKDKGDFRVEIELSKETVEKGITR
ncbi:hypothetical protein [Lysinibacillus parviboronicapiens]|nr:hypothetical protein [Lysinibacillus parviboronicapiens]